MKLNKNIKVKSGFLEDYIDDFIKVATSLYTGDKNWVSSSKAETLHTLGSTDSYLSRGDRNIFIVYKNEEPVARVVASFDKESSEPFGVPTGFFSHFESENDNEVVTELFKKVECWFQEKNVSKIMGPMTPKISDTRGLLIQGEGKPLFGMPYTKNYYPMLLEKIGFSSSMNMYEYIVKLNSPYKKLEKVGSFIKRKLPKIKIRSLDLNDLYNELTQIIKVYNEAWKENWGFIPLKTDDFYEAFLPIMDNFKSDYCLIAEVDGECVGFQMIMPDLNNDTDTNVFRAFFIGVLPQYRNHGVESLLLAEVLNTLAVKYAIEYMHVAWVLENNIKWRKEIEKIVGKENIKLKKYTILEKNR
ncbi:GNAT family N-acetyltransferase [Priestia megaterium]|uniref:GNAT family N-acetyltransferase n=1 Tax=Priestia megaterium TaxID=1404 RepID=UPI0012D8B241|nr:GNAT family N-acetyltransferase [Priestia megaterium]MUL34442.1 Acetyltransferase YpeA [Priestia megaterium]